MWNIESITGYQPKTTFWQDFSIAEKFGANEIKDTYNRAFKSWKENTEYITEFVMVLNWKSWHFDAAFEQTGESRYRDYSRLYADLYHEVHDWCLDNLKGEDLSYYLMTTD